MLLVCWQWPALLSHFLSWATLKHGPAEKKSHRRRTGRRSELGKSACIIYSSSLFTQKHSNPHRFGAMGGGRGSALYQRRDLQSLEKKRIQLCRENKPKGRWVQRAAGPERAPLGFGRRVGSSRKLHHRAEGAQRVGLYSNKYTVFFVNSPRMLCVYTDTNMRRNNPRLLSLALCCSPFWNDGAFETKSFLCLHTLGCWMKSSDIPGTEKKTLSKTMSVPGCFYSRWGRKSAPRWGCFIKRLQLDEQAVINSSDSSDEGESENEKNNFYIFFLACADRY